MKPLVAIVHDTRRAKTNDKYPVKVRVTFNRKQMYYLTSVDLTKEEWEKLHGERLSKDIRDIKNQVSAAELKAEDICKNMKTFTFAQFEKQFYTLKNIDGSLVNLYHETIAEMKKDGRISSATSYDSSIKSLKEFKQKVNFQDITVDFLKQYEKWMLGKEHSITTVGIYLRPLRAIFNIAIPAGLVGLEQYPFGKKKYEIPSGRNIKKALSIADVGRIFNYPAVPGTTLEKARDFWIFTYCCNGINMKDVALLQYKNIKGDYINFVRSKTEHSTRASAKAISIVLNDDTKAIIKKWGNKDTKQDNYIFPIITKEMTAEKMHATIHQFVKTVNKYMKRIAEDLGLDKHVTTYTARHTFSTVLKRSGASTEFIGEALGHSNKKTTESYLDSFEQEAQKEMAKKLMAFK